MQSQERRTQLLNLGAAAVFLAIVGVVVLIVVNGNSSSEQPEASNLQEEAAVEKLLAGIPQEGLTLGDPKAPVELIEFGDLQCPFCKQYSEELLPPVIEGQVQQGQAKITFRNFVILGEESNAAGQAALAAGEQGAGWNYIELFYRNQGTEKTGYVTDEFMEAVAKGAGVKNLKQWNEERNSKRLKEEVEETTNEALNKFQFGGTPSFAIKGPSTNGIELIAPETVEDFEEAINAAS